MATRSKPAAPGPPLEIASGVFFLEVGRGFMRSNVYFVQSGSSWVLIDAASAHCAPAIRAGAASVFGVDSAPSAILLTHCHPDHDGSARELATVLEMPGLRASGRAPDRLWGHGRHREVCESVGSPADTAFPAASRDGDGCRPLIERSSLEGVIRPLDPHDSVPGLPDWELILTPGHTPGHVAFFRPLDRVLITGDALVTKDLNSLPGALSGRTQVAGPPWYTTWDWKLAKRSAVSLAGLRPLVVAGGHGRPMSGSEVARSARSLLSRWI